MTVTLHGVGGRGLLKKYYSKVELLVAVYADILLSTAR